LEHAGHIHNPIPERVFKIIDPKKHKNVIPKESLHKHLKNIPIFKREGHLKFNKGGLKTKAHEKPHSID
jgi:hypothetical protein